MANVKKTQMANFATSESLVNQKDVMSEDFYL